MRDEEFEVIRKNIDQFNKSGDDINSEALSLLNGSPIQCIINVPRAFNIISFCNYETYDLKTYNYYIIALSFSIKTNIKSFDFIVELNDKIKLNTNEGLNDKEHIEVRDKYPKIVSKIRSVKLGINNNTKLFEQIQEGGYLVYEYDELHPVIQFKEPICWSYSEQSLLSEKVSFLLLKAPKNRKEILADLILKYNAQDLGRIEHINLIGWMST